MSWSMCNPKPFILYIIINEHSYIYIAAQIWAHIQDHLPSINLTTGATKIWSVHEPVESASLLYAPLSGSTTRFPYPVIVP